METVLLVGGSGFIGRHVAAELTRSGRLVYASHRAGSRMAAVQGVRWVVGDLADEAGLAFWPRKCDAVLFLAQARAWRSFPENAADVFAVNVGGLMRVAEYAHKAGARHLVYASTGSVYTQSRQQARENDTIDVLAPRSFYAASKLAGEVILRPYETLMRIVGLRLFMPYGAGQSPDMLLPSLVRCVRERRPIMLHHPDGLVCNPVAVRDVAKAFQLCLSLDQSTTLNVGGPHELTLRRIGATIGGVIGTDPVFDYQPGIPPVVVGDCTELRTALGWAPAIDVETGLREWLELERISLSAAG